MKLNSGMFIPLTENTLKARQPRTGGAKKPSKYHPHPMQSTYIQLYSPEEWATGKYNRKRIKPNWE